MFLVELILDADQIYTIKDPPVFFILHNSVNLQQKQEIVTTRHSPANIQSTLAAYTYAMVDILYHA